MTIDMKKVLAILSAGLMALMAVSCFPEDEVAVFDPSKITPPSLGSYAFGEEEITVNYLPAKIEVGFNEKMATRHTLAIVALDGSEVSKSLTTSDDGSTLTLKKVNLSKALVSLGKKEGETARVELAVRATIQDASKDNGINGFVDSEKHMGIASFLVEIPEQVGSPYEEYTQKSDWSLIGSMAAYGISWDGDLNMWTDGNGNHVAAHVVLKAGDEVKFRKDQSWDVNFGGTLANLGEEFTVTQGGDNIKIAADGVYDLFLNESGTAIVAAGYDPYPEFTQETNWTVIGSLSKYGISWDGDIDMVSNGTVSAAFGVALSGDDEFKFRQDKAWTVNLGGDFGGLDTDFAVSQDGPNVKVGAEGVYDLFVDPAATSAKVTAACGLKISTKIGAAETPEPEPVTGWNIIGLNGDWENDVLATNEGNVWTAFITAEAETEFKWRKDGGWDENYGGTFVALGEPFDAVAGGDNIKIPAGFYKAVLDLDALKITISNGEVWSLIGAFNEWAGDVDMVLTDGKWVSPATKLDGEFKIRHNHDWAESVGGTLVAIGEPFAAISQDGPNITVEAGTYVVTYDPTAATIVVDEIGWGVVGTINSWGGTPDIALKEDGLFLVAKNVTLTADDEIKIRYNQDWGVNRGAMTAVGVPVKAEQDGGNIKPGAGTFDIYYRPDCEVIIVNEAGAALNYWGVVGTINSWSAPDVILYQNADGLLESKEITVSATDEIKIRVNEDWAVNRGGTFAELGEAIAVAADGPNIKVGREAKIQVVYDATAETITLKGEYVGDAPALPTTMYMIGAQFGNWSWDDAGVADFVPITGTQGKFWLTRWFDHTKGFKFCAQKAWSGDFTGAGAVGYTVSDGNCFVAEDGFYTVYIDAADNTVEISPAEVYGIGDAWGADAWDFNATDPVMFVAEGQTMVATVTNNSTAVRLATKVTPTQATDGITPNGWFDWWKTEYVFFDGKIAYRGLGGDQERVAVTAGQKLTLDFNAGTATLSGGAPAAPSITIDGDMSDWAAVEGTVQEVDASSAAYITEVKGFADADNIYVYVKRAKQGRWNEVWGGDSGKTGYYYYDFDLDNNPETGDQAENSHGNYEAYCYVYIFGGTADAPVFRETPPGSFKGMTGSNLKFNGVVTDTDVEVEAAFPRADLPAITGDTISVSVWGNKDGNPFTKVTFKVQ